MANKTLRTIILEQNSFDALLCSTGYLFPRNENELDELEKSFEIFDFKLKGFKINPDEIINGNFTLSRNNPFIESKEKMNDIKELRIAARKGETKIPNSVLEKMKKKHRNEE